MNARWVLKPLPQEAVIERLALELSNKATPSTMWRLIALLLAQRSVYSYDEARSFFRPSLENLHNPYLMKDMDKAVQRIIQSVENQENILVYGDYDVDGTSAVALVYSFLLTIYPNVSYYIPDRYTEGYGVSIQGIDYAYDNEVKLIIALDCGTKDTNSIEYARQKQIDFVVCDHHRPSEQLPCAVAILNPKQNDCPYPYKELCGCGIGFKLVQALVSAWGLEPQTAFKYLDLVAIATAADIVPMTGENRILVHYGLQCIEKTPSLGVQAMIGHLPKPISITQLVFVLAPRINAAGRIKHAEYAVKLLTETNQINVKNIIADIEEFNTDRKIIDKDITQQALQQIISNDEQNQCTTVVCGEDWHKGVIGIVASRLIETYYRPTIVFTHSGGKLSGSARSVKGFDVYDAIEKCSEFVEQFGGHKYAAGLTILPDNYIAFKQRFEQVVDQTIPRNLLTPEISIDTEIQLEEVHPNFYHILKQFAPFGPQNMTPIFLTRNVRFKQSLPIGEDKKHLRCLITDSQEKITLVGVGFGLGHKHSVLAQQQLFDIVYSIEENTWQGKTSLQLHLRDIR